MYHVMLQFEDEEAALDFVDHSDGSASIIHQGKVVAIYKAPTLFCDGHGGKKTAIGYTMGMKWGWWVCATCKKPSKLYWQNIVERQSSFGKNLLKVLFTDD